MALKENLDLSEKTILIVDDQKPFQVMLKGMLHNMGASSVFMSITGENAIAKCKEHPFDLVFIDYNLGAGKNGRQLLEELKARKLVKPACICVLVTGESQVNMVVGAVETQPDDYIVKPFSQNLFRQRLTRLAKKKSALLNIDKEIARKDWTKAIEYCDVAIEKHPRYRTQCLKTKAEMLFRLERFDEAELITDGILSEKEVAWALLLKAKIRLANNDFKEAAGLSVKALRQSNLNIDAYDILTDCYLAMDEIQSAYTWIRNGVDLSPFSVRRQYKLSKVAKVNEDYEAAIAATKQIVDITERSFSKDPSHKQNHVRNIIDACESETDKIKRRKFNQEAAHALQQLNKEIREDTADPTIHCFDVICQARIDSLNGNNLKAKRSFGDMVKQLDCTKTDLPGEYTADAVSLQLQIGEYEQALELAESCKQGGQQLDEFTQEMMLLAQQKAQEKIDQFKEYNREGISLFKEGKWIEAKDKFELALVLAPMNTGAALNLIQVLVQLIENDPKSKWPIIEECKKLFKVVDSSSLNEAHELRAKELRERMEMAEEQK